MSRNPLRILLVEDNPSDVELALHALESHRLDNPIDVARDGQEALEYLSRSNEADNELPHLILLDIKLPLVDGLEVLERIKSEPDTCHIPVVVLTSSNEGPDIERAYQLGANSYIVKPVEFAQFCDTVRQLGMYWLLFNQPSPP